VNVAFRFLVRNLLANDAVRPNCCACYYSTSFVVFGTPVRPVERSAFFCRTYSLVMRVIPGKHVNVLAVCNEPCVIGPLRLVRLIGHSGCPGIGEITEPGRPLPPLSADDADGVLCQANGVSARPDSRAGLARKILHVRTSGRQEVFALTSGRRGRASAVRRMPGSTH
jgi:hypothetical protein